MFQITQVAHTSLQVYLTKPIFQKAKVFKKKEQAKLFTTKSTINFPSQTNQHCKFRQIMKVQRSPPPPLKTVPLSLFLYVLLRRCLSAGCQSCVLQACSCALWWENPSLSPRSRAVVAMQFQNKLHLEHLL